MDPVQYVNKVGKQINDSVKFDVSFDHDSIQNLILYNHLIDVYNKAQEDSNITTEQLKKLFNEIECLKKHIKFYANKDVDDDCILTEVEEHIIQE